MHGEITLSNLAIILTQQIEITTTSTKKNMNILIKWIFKAEQAFYTTTIRFFPTLAINQGLLSDWDNSRLTSELNRTTFDEEVCQELGYNRGAYIHVEVPSG